MVSNDSLIESVPLSQAKAMIRGMAHQQSFLLLSPPGVGKSDMVYQAAAEANLPLEIDGFRGLGGQGGRGESEDRGDEARTSHHRIAGI